MLAFEIKESSNRDKIEIHMEDIAHQTEIVSLHHKSKIILTISPSSASKYFIMRKQLLVIMWPKNTNTKTICWLIIPIFPPRRDCQTPSVRLGVNRPWSFLVTS